MYTARTPCRHFLLLSQCFVVDNEQKIEPVQIIDGTEYSVDHGGSVPGGMPLVRGPPAGSDAQPRRTRRCGSSVQQALLEYDSMWPVGSFLDLLDLFVFWSE